MLKHPLTHSHVATRTLRLRDDAGVAKGSRKDGGEGIASGVMDGRVEADTMGALYEVATIRPMVGGAASKSTVGADGVGDERRRTEEEVEGKGGGVVVWTVEPEAVRDGDALEPGGGTVGHSAVEETRAPLGGRSGGEQGQEISRNEGSSGDRSGVWECSLVKGLKAVQEMCTG